MAPGLEPGVGALFLEGLADALVDRLVLEDVVGRLVVEHGDRHAPGALAAQHPIGAIGDHGAQAVLAGGRVELRRIDGSERAGAQRVAGFLPVDVAVHVDEPLRRVAEDDRLLRAPASADTGA